MVDSDFVISVFIRTPRGSRKAVTSHQSPLDAQKWLLRKEEFKYIKMGYLVKQPFFGGGGKYHDVVMLN